MLKPRYVIAVFLLSVPLMGMRCAGTQWTMKGECKTSGNGAGDCTVSGSMSGQFLRNATVAERLLSLNEILDAADFSIDVSRSTVAVPSRGSVNIKLIQQATGAVRASRVFPWTKSGTRLVLSNPDAVNDWAAQSGSTADSIGYDLLPFSTSEQVGWNTLSTEANYSGETQAAATTTWRGWGQTCPNDPLKRARHCP